MKDRIVPAGIDEINEKGLKFTMSDLAERLAVSKRTLYESYPSKDALISDIVDTTIKRLEKQDREILEHEEYSLYTKIEELLNYQYKSNLTLTNIFFISLRRYYPLEWAKFLRFRENKLEYIDKLFCMGFDEGYFRDVNRKILKIMISASVDALFEQKNLCNIDMSYKQAISQMGDILFNGVLKKQSFKAD